MKIKILKTYRWGNYCSCIHYRFGLLSIIIFGLSIDILLSKKKYIVFVERVSKNNQISLDTSSFPFSYSELI